MSDDATILVLGMDELASAVARKLHLAGYAVAIHQAAAPRSIRRRMSFVDAWTDGSCAFEGVEARRADKRKDFLASLKSGASIPVLCQPFEEVASRWPFDIIVDARTDPAAAPEQLCDLADVTIGLGSGYAAGANCDILIDTGARDPGGIIRQGRLRRQEGVDERRFADGRMTTAPHNGLFHGAKQFGDSVAKGDVIGSVGPTPVLAPCAGRVRGLMRDGASVQNGAEIIEIVASPRAEIAGITKRDRLIARSVAFVIEMERSGFAPISLENFL